MCLLATLTKYINNFIANIINVCYFVIYLYCQILLKIIYRTLSKYLYLNKIYEIGRKTRFDQYRRINTCSFLDLSNLSIPAYGVIEPPSLGLALRTFRTMRLEACQLQKRTNINLARNPAS